MLWNVTHHILGAPCVGAYHANCMRVLLLHANVSGLFRPMQTFPDVASGIKFDAATIEIQCRTYFCLLRRREGLLSAHGRIPFGISKGRIDVCYESDFWNFYTLRVDTGLLGTQTL